jgi:hypothetical protein
MPQRQIVAADVQSHTFFTSALDSGAATLLGNNPGTHCIRYWVGPTADLDVLEKRKVSCPCLDSNSKSSSHSLLTIPNELS